MMVIIIGPIPTNGGSFGTSSVPVLLDNINCYGIEDNILQCKDVLMQRHSCSSNSKDVGVVCAGKKPYTDNC